MAFTVYGRGAPDATSDLLRNYHVSDMESQGNPSDVNPHYFGYVNKDCNWYISRVTGETVRYARGLDEYDANWVNRAALGYFNFQDIF